MIVVAVSEPGTIAPGPSLPKSTAVAFSRFVPVTVTYLPPAVGPDGGVRAPVAMLETAGRGT